MAEKLAFLPRPDGQTDRHMDIRTAISIYRVDLLQIKSIKKISSIIVWIKLILYSSELDISIIVWTSNMISCDIDAC